MPLHMTLQELESIVGDAGLEARLLSGTYTPGDAGRLADTYQAVFKRKLNQTCCNCLYDAFVLLKIDYKTQYTQMEEQIQCRFALKAGVVLAFENTDGKRRLYTNANLTDKIARDWLGVHHDKRHYFSKIPSDYDAHGT